MPLVNAKCTNCGGTLTVDSSQEAAVCNYCGSAFIVEKAIQNYNYHITNNITAQNVIISGKGEMEKERLLQNAQTNENFKEYNKALEIYTQVTEDYPDDYRGWYGLAAIITENFQNTKLADSNFQQVKSYIQKALISVQGHKDTEIREKWNDYCQRRDQFIAENVNELNKLEEEKEQTIQELNSLSQQRNALIDKSGRAAYKMEKRGKVGLLLKAWFIFGALLAIAYLCVYEDVKFSTQDIPYYVVFFILPLSIIIYKLIAFSVNKKIKKTTDSQVQELNSKIETVTQKNESLTRRINDIKNTYNI